MRIITRKEALARGLTYYFTGKRCKYRHVCERWTSNRGCVECRRTTHLAYSRAAARKWNKEHPERHFANVRNWKRENPNTNAAWIGLAGARKRAPNCVRKDFNFKATIPFYAEARRLTRETGVLHHVDHIKALADGGKHEATNLQVLTAKQNRTKATAEHRTNRRRSR